MPIVLAHQVHFIGQPKGITVIWGYALYPDKEGNFIKKKTADCTREEIRSELLYRLRFGAEKEALLDSFNCIPCMMPYIISQF